MLCAQNRVGKQFVLQIPEKQVEHQLGWKGGVEAWYERPQQFRENLSSTVYEVGGQGKTEKWNNTLPSYAMVHLMYKFSKAPKGKK